MIKLISKLLKLIKKTKKFSKGVITNLVMVNNGKTVNQNMVIYNPNFEVNIFLSDEIDFETNLII